MRVVIDTNVIVSAALKDRKPEFLACALAAKADYLITGDKDFENAYKIGSTSVLSVSLVNKLVCDAWEIN